MVNSRDALFKTGDIIEGRYRIHKVLGEGGMGTVFLAEHTLIKRRVAIKILHPELATDSDVIERFMNEARAAGMLGHPNIVESTDMGFTGNNIPYIVFEYLEGTLLTDEIYRVGGLPIRRAMKIVAQIASALHAAHNAGIVHRDLKSDNIFLTDKDDSLDHVKVLDFGISRFLATEADVSTVMGTPEFMAPEQITAPSTVDCRADIYALGVILYEMLEARRPFASGDDPRALMERIVRESPPPMQRKELPHDLVHIIHDRMLAKDPADRFQSMVDVVAALEQFTTRDHTPLPRKLDDIARYSTTIPKPVQTLHTPWPAPRAASAPPVRMGGKRPVALYAMAAAGVAIGGIGLGFGLRGGSEPAPVAVQPTQPAPAASVPQPAPVPEIKKVAVTIDADVASARYVFRRRLQPVGAAMELTPSDVVELVEVSAPGYKTVRYWLTFDRETHLHAHLDKGTGATEATEEQTLVALGELADKSAPTAVAAMKPASAPAAATAAAAAAPMIAKKDDSKVAPRTEHTIERAVTKDTTEARMAPRKIGRAADGQEALVETSTAKPENVQVVADVAAPIQPAIAPPPAPPEPAPMVPTPAKPEVTTPAPAPTPAPAVAAVRPNSAPSIVSPKAVRKVSGDAPQITLDHYDGADLPAVLTAKLCIDTSGHVMSATMIGKVAQSRLGDEIAATLHTWVYAPYSKDGAATPVCFPVALRTR